MNNLLLLSSDYPPMDGGIARLCSAIASGCSRSGVGVKVIAPAAGGYTPSADSEISEIRIDGSRPWRELRIYRELRRHIGLGPIVCGLWYPDGLLAQLASMRPRIVLAHGLELMPAKALWRRRAWAGALRNILESAELVVANSHFTRELVLEKAPRARVVAIPLAVNHEQFCPGDVQEAKRRLDVSDKIVLSSVSRLHGYKGHETVLRALATLKGRGHRKFMYLIAGRGPHQHRLQQCVAELELKDQVRFLGFVPEDDLPNLYRASDLFLLCTTHRADRQEVEGFGLVFLEAQACGTPVVGTRTGGIPDAIVEGRGGWLIDQGDSETLWSILAKLADDPGPFVTMGRLARRRVELECTWDRYMERFRSALETEGIHVG